MNSSQTISHVLRLKPGDLIEVRSEAEILGTLDERGALDGLPFMPEMLQHCGRQFRVGKRADKTCDTIHKTGGRRMQNAVHLELRCDGGAHGGCQASCLIFWKEAWLTRVDAPGAGSDAGPALLPTSPGSAREALARAARVDGGQATDPQYACQATELYRATTPLPWWDMRQYWRDLRYGNVGVLVFARVVALAVYNLLRRRIGRPQHPYVQGRLEGRTPGESLGLQTGELVQVKSKEEIESTLTVENRNRGLWFDVEMVPYCGRAFRVLKRVERIIDEKTGRMIAIANDCVILDGVVCSGHLSQRRLFCPRAIYSYWRETWLRRLPAPPMVSTPPER